MMKNIIVLFAGGDMSHALTPIHASVSAFTASLAWAKTVQAELESAAVLVLTRDSCRDELTQAAAAAPAGFLPSFDLLSRPQWTNGDIASEIAAACDRTAAGFAIFAWADCPFLNLSLTKELVHIQCDYKAEYTFADGFPYGFAPEIIDGGTARIVAALAKNSQKAAGEKTAARDAFFSIMSGDINSFEVETHLAEKDYRMLRLSFDCGSKATALCCQRAWNLALQSGLISGGEKTEQAAALSALDVYALADLAEKDAGVLQTLPAFYNLQISGSYSHGLRYSPYKNSLPHMRLEDFKSLCADMAATSERAVVSLSFFGEPLLHPDFTACVKVALSHPGLSLFIETDGLLVTESLAKEIAGLDGGNAAQRVIWCILLDAATAALYQKMHGITDGERAQADFAAATKAVALLAEHFPHAVYPQFVRTKENECELEAFYRFWKKPDSPSCGELIIQKYDRFCGLLPDEKSADLSPLQRFPCWHLRRDMCVFSDGSVPFCKSASASYLTGAGGKSAIAGNVLKEGIAPVWARFSEALAAQIEHSYNEECKACDEYYTFNF